MHNTLEFLVRHGYLLLLIWIFLEQLGLPIPSGPLLLAAGALGGMNRLNLGLALGVSVFAALCADMIWYELGRRKGIRILQWLCRISLEPDSCVRRTEGVFEKQGAKSLLVSKFLPGLNTVATPLAGVFQMRLSRFLLFDVLGAIIWAGSYMLVGFLFRDQLELVGQKMAQLGGGLLVVLVGVLAAYIAYKYFARQRFLRELRIARIRPEELKEKIDAGESLTIVDLRHSVDFEADPELIPGALHMNATDLEASDHTLPLDREVVLYCT